MLSDFDSMLCLTDAGKQDYASHMETTINTAGTIPELYPSWPYLSSKGQHSQGA